MDFTKHYELQGKHAFLSPSQNAWLNYDEEKLKRIVTNSRAKELGTRLHELASELIELKQKLPRSNKTLNAFVNDAIGYRMESEVVLYFSEFCFGTADAISFKKNLLRIHDLKTGVTPVSMQQLMVYSALFCLEYKKSPSEIDIELRIYQLDEVITYIPTPEEVRRCMDRIIESDKIISMMDGGTY